MQATTASANEAAAQAGQVVAPASEVLLQLRAAEAAAIANCTRGICVETTDPGAAASHAAPHIEAAFQACNAAVHAWAATHLRGLPAGHPVAAGALAPGWAAAAGPRAPAAGQAEGQGRCRLKRPRQADEAASTGTAAVTAEAGAAPQQAAQGRWLSQPMEQPRGGEGASIKSDFEVSQQKHTGSADRLLPQQ